MFIESAGGFGNQLFIWNLAHTLEAKYNETIWIFFPGESKTRENHLVYLKNFCKHNIRVVDHEFFGRATRAKDRIVRLLPKFKNSIEELLRLVEIGFPLFQHEMMDFTDHVLSKSENIDRRASAKIENAAHLRRGDYEQLMCSYGILDSSYYISIAQDRKWKSVAFFTDSLKSVAQDFVELKETYFVGPNQLTDIESFALMTTASELAIANSTFSWWAGKLCALKGGLVFAPKPWHLNSQYSRDYLQDNAFIPRKSVFMASSAESC